jgi:ribose transport system substrate-binding protein
VVLVNIHLSRRRFLQASAAAAAGAAAIGRFPQPVRAQGERLKFVFSPKETANPVFGVAKSGGETRAAELGDVDFVWIGPDAADAQRQAEMLDAAIIDGCDGMGISVNNADVLKPVIDRATEAGIPVITWDSDSPDSSRLSFYSFETQSAATAGAELFRDIMAEHPVKTYALLSGVAGAPNLEERIAAVRAVLDATDLELVQTVYCDDNIQKGATVVEDQMTATPDLGGWFMIGGWPLFGDVNAMPQFVAAAQAGTLKTVAWDTLWMQLPLIVDGTVQGLIGQKYYGWGYDGVGILYDHVKHNITLPPFVDSGYDLVTTPEQAQEFIEAWETEDFKPDVPKFGNGDAAAYEPA